MLAIITTNVWALANSVFILLAVLTASVVLRKQTKQIESLKTSINALQQANSALTNSTVGMGRRLSELQQQAVANASSAHSINSNDALLKQATRLVQLGASVNDLVDNCGVPRGEAELLVSMQKQKML